MSQPPEKSNRGGDRKSGMGHVHYVKGRALFCAETGTKKEWLKAVLATAEGVKALRGHDEIDIFQFNRAANLLLNSESSGLPPNVATWKEAGEFQRAGILEIQKNKLKGELMPTSEAKRQNGEAWAFSFDYWSRHLCNEGPPEHAGRNAIELFQRYSKLVEDYRKEAQEKFEKAA